MSKEKVETVAVSGSAVQLMEDGDEVLHNPESTEEVQYADPSKDDTTEDTEVETKTASNEPTTESLTEDEDDVPAELLNKSPKELARMVRESQKMIGRHGKELGELRALADQHLRAALAASTKQLQGTGEKPAAKEAPAPLTDADYFANPKAAIERAIAEHPEVQRLRATEQEAKAEMLKGRMMGAKSAFEKAHPDAAEIISDPSFRAWIQADPIRQRMLVAADRNYDFTAGNSLFNTWKEIKSARQPVADAGKEAQAAKAKAAKQAAKVPTGGNAAPKASTGEKIYKRADLIRLQINDPDRYELMGKEIETAYREGRVR